MHRIIPVLRFRSSDPALDHRGQLARALAGRGHDVLLVDLSPGAGRPAGRGAGRGTGAALLSALGDPQAGPPLAAAPTDTAGLSILPIGAAGSEAAAGGGPETLLAGAIGRLQGHHGLIVVEAPPTLDGIAASRWIVAPCRGAACDLQGGLIIPLAQVGLTPEPGLGTDGALLGVMVIPGVEVGGSPDLDADAPDAGPARDGALIPRTYHLRGATINFLRACCLSLSDRLGRHVRRSEVVGVAIRTSPVLHHTDLLDVGGELVPRTYHLRPRTIAHLDHLALLAGNIVGRHVRLSTVVDVAIRLFSREPPRRQAGLIVENRRRNLDNRA